jgi:histidinol-phosphate/aromatic aminotransferase/cobyric acid decarboxylase-like protein
MPVPVTVAELLGRSPATVRAIVVSRPADPTGVVVPLADLRALAGDVAARRARDAHVRVTLRDPAATDRLLEALRELHGAPPP